jgi:hypothetical protein
MSNAAQQAIDRQAEEDAWIEARELDEAYLAAQEEHAEMWRQVA